MNEKIVIPINDIVLTKKNIVGLATCISCQPNARYIRFTIKFVNDIEIASDDISIFEMINLTNMR